MAERAACAHAGRACGARGDAQCAEWPGRGRAPGVHCAGRLCVQARRGCVIRASVQMSGARGRSRRSPALRGALRSSARGAYSPGLHGRGRRSVPGSGSGSGLSAPGSRLRPPQRARTGAKPGGAPEEPPLQCPPRPPGRSAARAGGSAEAGAAVGSCAAVGHAPGAVARSWRSARRSLI